MPLPSAESVQSVFLTLDGRLNKHLGLVGPVLDTPGAGKESLSLEEEMNSYAHSGLIQVKGSVNHSRGHSVSQSVEGRAQPSKP